MRDPILITGCARSGTSMTAGIIDICGAFGGRIAGPNQWNRKGMFENTEIREKIIKPYLLLNGCDPKGQNPLPDIDRLFHLENLREKMVSIFQFQEYEHGPWYYKGAKMCLIWNRIHEAFPKAKWIIVRRDDEGIVRSCMKTAFMNAYRKPKDWQKHWVEVHKTRFIEMKEAGLDIQEVWPTKFIEGDFSEVQSVVEGLGLEWKEDRVKEFISPELWGAEKEAS